MNLAVLASTNGTDLQAIIDALNAGTLTGVNLKLVASNKKKCYALQRAEEQGFKTLFISAKDKTREQFDYELAKALKEEEIELIALVGYMRLLTPEFVQAFPNQIINVHPSLIPKFSGKNFYGSNVHKAVIAAKETETGCTIHFVDEGCDTGKIIVQKKVAVSPEDTPETLKDKVQALEKEWYPKVIQKFANGEIEM